MFTLVIVASSVVGCASQPTAPQPAASPPLTSAVRSGPPAASGGLAFDPPIAAHVQPTDLSRNAREPTASNGVVVNSTSNYNVTTSIQDTTTDGNYNQSTTTSQSGTVQH